MEVHSFETESEISFAVRQQEIGTQHSWNDI